MAEVELAIEAAEMTAVNGKAAAFGGFRLSDVLHEAGVSIGASVKGRAARAHVRVSASDGYSAVFTLAGLDTTHRVA